MGVTGSSCISDLQTFLKLYQQGADLRTDAEYRAAYMACRGQIEKNVKGAAFPTDFQVESYNLFSILVIFSKFELANFCVKVYTDPLAAMYSTYHQRLTRPKRTLPETDNAEAMEGVLYNEVEVLAKQKQTWADVRQFLITLLTETKDLSKPLEMTSIPYLEVCIELGLASLTEQVVRKWTDSYRVKYSLSDIVGCIAQSEDRYADFSGTLEYFLPSQSMDDYVNLLLLLVNADLGLQYADWIFKEVVQQADPKEFLCSVIESSDEDAQEALQEVLGAILEQVQSTGTNSADMERFLKTLLVNSHDMRQAKSVSSSDTGVIVNGTEAKKTPPPQGGCILS